MTLDNFLVLGAVVFCIGLFGALSKRNAVSILMSIEIMLNAVNITLVAYASAFMAHAPTGVRLTGQVFAVFIITVAAAEAAVALAMIIAIYRRRQTIDVGQINLMRW
jgi:NADH:ubiquinone oxidoreductase subunit K